MSNTVLFRSFISTNLIIREQWPQHILRFTKLATSFFQMIAMARSDKIWLRWLDNIENNAKWRSVALIVYVGLN